MKVKIFFVLCIFMTNPAFAVTEESFEKLRQETAQYLETHNNLSPNSEEKLTFKELGLTIDDFNAILQNLDYDEQNYLKRALSPSGNEINAEGAIWTLEHKIIENLNKIFSHRDFAKHDITTLFNPDLMNVVKSADNKLINFSYPENTGGSYHSRISMMVFTDLNPKKLFRVDSSDTNNPYHVFDSDGYNEIYSIKAGKQTKYLLKGNVQSCNTCFSDYIALVKFENEKFVREFYYETTTRDGTGSIIYDEDSKTIEVEYATDDLRKHCQFKNLAESDLTEEQPELKLGTECHCQFTFNGRNFENSKDCGKS